MSAYGKPIGGHSTSSVKTTNKNSLNQKPMEPKLVQTSEENYSLLLTEFAACEEVFNEFDHEGGGYDWESVVKHVLETEHTDLFNKVRFDSEGSMFCVYGKDKEALETVGEIVKRLIDDHTELKRIIASVPENDWD
ncbi:MAG: immunity 51 family protein [Cytophagales bacterium]|nr:immunity 51 family protein [Cytophagales bacterium]